MAEQDGLAWRKSSYSSDGTCVETAITSSHVLVRDSKDPNGQVLSFNFVEWKAFLQGVKEGEFEL